MFSLFLNNMCHNLFLRQRGEYCHIVLYCITLFVLYWVICKFLKILSFVEYVFLSIISVLYLFWVCFTMFRVINYCYGDPSFQKSF